LKVAIEDTFELTCDAYEALYFDEPFNIALGDALGLGRELLRLDRTADRIIRHVRCEPKQDPDSPAKQAFGTSRASFVEELDYDRRTRRGTWQTVPNLFVERVTNRGTLELAPAGGGVKRIVRGEVKVSLFGFGRLVEKMIVAEIEKSYASAARFTRAWLARETPR
jgi:hypothetical protein